MIVLNQTLTAEEAANLTTAINQLAENNADFIKQLQKLADLKTQQPKLWEAGKKFLKL